MQPLVSQLPCRLYADVGHNVDAARAQAVRISQLKTKGARVVVLLGMLQDKQPELFVRELAPQVDEWWLLSTGSDRGLPADRLAARIGDQLGASRRFESVDAALDHALSSLGNPDIMLVTGSFVTVELLLRALSDSGE